MMLYQVPFKGGKNMLLSCPECALPVSDKANSCPHCGMPLKSNIKSKKSKRRMRLPNSFGSITVLKTKRLSKPYLARVTIGYDSLGKPIRKTLKPEGYFSSYNDAYAALVEYNKSPYELEKNVIMTELYDRWSTEYFKKLKSNSSVRTITASWKYCESVYKLPVKAIRVHHIKMCIDNAPSVNIKSRIKSVFNLMFDYAVEYELMDRNPARAFKISDEITEQIKKVKKDHLSFSDNEMNIMWQNVNDYYTRMIIIQCYMGWRPQELCLIETKNVNITEKIIIGGLKTVAGIDRKVPIHPYILPFIKELYDQANALNLKYLFKDIAKDNGPLTYDKYKTRFSNTMQKLKLNIKHRPHDPRKQFITMAKRYNVDEYAIKKIAGHSISDITEKIYTDRKPDWLFQEICKIKLGAPT